MKPSHLPTITFPVTPEPVPRDFADLLAREVDELRAAMAAERERRYGIAFLLTNAFYLDTLARVENGSALPHLVCVLPDDHPAVT